MREELTRLDVVFAKELADAAGISVRQVQDRMALWRADKTDPRGIPHLPQLGIPWRMSRAQAKAFLHAEAVS